VSRAHGVNANELCANTPRHPGSMPYALVHALRHLPAVVVAHEVLR